MNVIGLFVPKIVSLLTIWIPSYNVKEKLLLFAIWALKLLIDYSIAQLGHKGWVYKITKNIAFETGEVIIALIQLIPALFFLVLTILLKMWIPFVPGFVAVILLIVQFVQEIIEAISMRNHH